MAKTVTAQVSQAMYLAGEWVTSQESLDVINPYDGSVVGTAYLADKTHVEKAIAAAAAAFEATRALSAYTRVNALRHISRRLNDDKEAIAKIITAESGKTIQEARGEVGRAVMTFDLAAEEARRLGGEILPFDLAPGQERRVGLVRRFPIGPITGITPFNFPLNLVAHKMAPAIACGNPIIIKPASKTPLTALALAHIVDETDLPKGSVSVLPCRSDQADALISDPRIKQLSFTGGLLGWDLKERAGRKKVVLELGGNAAAVVHEDADLEFAVKRVTFGGFAQAGQSCISVQRLFVHAPIAEKFLAQFAAAAGALTMGDPAKEETAVGPMIDDESAARTERWVNDAVKRGARILCGGKRNGRFFEPTILTGVPTDASLCTQEVFAPVVIAAEYADFTDALRSVNESAFGLHAGVFTRDLARIMEAYNTLDVGGVIVNEVPTYRADAMPYGGVKQSGIGREGLKYAIEEMTELKVLALNL